MLENRLYEIRCMDVPSLTAEIEFIPSSDIYAAHFPGKPVTPGACLVQIAGELLEKMVSSGLCLSEARSIKFASPLSPDKTISARFEFVDKGRIDGIRNWSVLVSDSGVPYCRMSLGYKENQ